MLSREKDQELCRKFPLLYRDRNGDRSKTLMVYGFSIKEGWYSIVYELSAALEPLIAAQLKSSLMFKSKVILYKALKYFGLKVVVPQKQSACAMQVKEKFGGLRFYMAGPQTKEMSYLIRQAEEKSFNTCEVCAAQGVLRTEKRWMLTLCDTCDSK